MTAPSPSIEVRDLHFAYAASPVLCGLSFNVFPGVVTAIVGANGSGKSTLLELIAGVRPLQSGALTRRGDVSLVLQRPDVPPTLPVTGRDTVAMGTWKHRLRMSRTDRSAAVEGALQRVGMGDFADRPLSTLSGGQRQRIFVAQSVARNPDILLLDEPSAGLDAASVVRTQEILHEEAARGATVVCVTHDDEAIASADRVIRLEHGHVAGSRETSGLR